MDSGLSKRYYSCFFTGHRIISNEAKERLFDIIIEKCEYLYLHLGVDTFICGGARGFDELCARAVIKLREKHKTIRLIIYIPCYNHYSKWNTNDKARWRYIHSLCDDFIYVTNGEYEAGCMQKRNLKMADDAHYCIAFLIKNNSGTGSAIKYAKSKGCDIENLAEYI